MSIFISSIKEYKNDVSDLLIVELLENVLSLNKNKQNNRPENS
jgi:hypothetical protein